jgi:hypothetical protein
MIPQLQEQKMADRTFLIQRYCTGNWPLVRGEKPFLATGPWFSTWGYGLDRYGEWRFVGQLGQQFEEAYGAEDDPRFLAAWALLETEIVQALWAEHSPVPPEERWIAAVEQLSAEIPQGPIGESVVEYLSGLSSPGHFRSYVAEDAIELVPMPCPGSSSSSTPS